VLLLSVEIQDLQVDRGHMYDVKNDGNTVADDRHPLWHTLPFGIYKYSCQFGPKPHLALALGR